MIPAGRYGVIVSTARDEAVGDSPFTQFVAWANARGVEVLLNEWDPNYPQERFLIFVAKQPVREWSASSGIGAPIAISESVKSRADLTEDDFVEAAAKQVYEAKEAVKETASQVVDTAKRAGGGLSAILIFVALYLLEKKGRR